MFSEIFYFFSQFLDNKIAIIISVLFVTIIIIALIYTIGQIFVIKEYLQNIDETNKKLLEELTKINKEDK